SARTSRGAAVAVQAPATPGRPPRRQAAGRVWSAGLAAIRRGRPAPAPARQCSAISISSWAGSGVVGGDDTGLVVGAGRLAFGEFVQQILDARDTDHSGPAVDQAAIAQVGDRPGRSEEHTSELQSRE